MPLKFPNKKIMAFDIGGSLAKVAFYLPKAEPQFQDFKNFELLTKDTIPSKYLRFSKAELKVNRYL